MSLDSILTAEAKALGFTLSEDAGHILELKLRGKVVARFSQIAVTVDNILSEVQQINLN